MADNGTVVSLDAVLAAELMFGDAPEQVAAAPVRRLRPVHRAVFSGVPGRIGWRYRPSTYVVCTGDLVVRPDLERAMAARATARHEWPGGHSLMVTRPAVVADLIASLARR